MTLLAALVARQQQRKRYRMHKRALGRALCARKGARKLTPIDQLVTCGDCLALMAEGKTR
jgi:hypothetical protein